MGLMDRLNAIDDKMGGSYLRPVSDPTRRRAQLERFLTMRFGPRYLPPVVLQELLHLRDRVDALEAQVQSLTSTDGS